MRTLRAIAGLDLRQLRLRGAEQPELLGGPLALGRRGNAQPAGAEGGGQTDKVGARGAGREDQKNRT